MPMPEISKGRMALGLIIFISGFLCPLMIPWVSSTDWPTGLKTVLSGLLAFGVPELFMVVSVAVMGKPGYEMIKKKTASLIQPLLPPDSVSLARYRLGLVMFCIPLLFGIAEPYLGYYFPFFEKLSIRWYLVTDLIFVISLFVLGGDFWDKLRGLFRHDVKVVQTRP